MKTLWIDLTDLAAWSGNLSGIQRLVYQMTLQYSKNDNVKYFVFSEVDKKFFETQFLPIKELIETPKVSTEENPGNQHSVGDAAKQAVLRLYGSLPDRIRDKLTPVRKERIKKLLVKSRSVVRRRSHASGVLGHGGEIQFASGDTVLVMGKPWDFPSFMESIRRQKLRAGFKLFQVVYDLIPVFEPHLHGEPLIKQYTQHMFEVAALSDGLVAISESTKRDMIKFCKELKLNCPPIKVIRLGDDFAKVEPRKPLKPSLKSGSYILNVGTIEIRKNHALLYTAYRLALEQGIDLPDLVIVGRPGWYTHDVLYEFTHDPELKNRVHILQDVDDAELTWLYENCMYTVYPSIYEGWGLPIAESLLYGKVCLPARSSSMVEIAGDLLEYYSPYDSRELLSLMAAYLDKAKRDNKEAEIAAKYKSTSWEQTASSLQEFVGYNN